MNIDRVRHKKDGEEASETKWQKPSLWMLHVEKELLETNMKYCKSQVVQRRRSFLSIYRKKYILETTVAEMHSESQLFQLRTEKHSLRMTDKANESVALIFPRFLLVCLKYW